MSESGGPTNPSPGGQPNPYLPPSHGEQPGWSGAGQPTPTTGTTGPAYPHSGPVQSPYGAAAQPGQSYPGAQPPGPSQTPQQPQGQPGYAAHGQPQYGPGVQPPQQNPYATYGVQQAAPAVPSYPMPPNDPKKASGRTAMIVLVAWVVVALVAATAWYLLKPKAEPVPKVTVPSAGASSSAPAPSPTNPVAPGAGRVDDIVAYVEDEDFTCAKEETTTISSYVCLGFIKGDEYRVYVGGQPTGELGRVALYSSADTETAAAKSMRSYLMGEFFGSDSMAADASEKIYEGTPETYESYEKDGITAWGASNGSIILIVDDWVPADVSDVSLGIDETVLEAKLAASGYKCDENGHSVECDRDEGANSFKVVYRTNSGEVVRVGMWAYVPKSAGEGTSDDEFASEFPPMMSVFEEGAEIRDEIEKFGDDEGYAYTGSILVDYYNDNEGDSDYFTGAVVSQSCWTDNVSWC